MIEILFSKCKVFPMSIKNERKPGKAQQRVDVIYAELRDRICLLRYPPGARLSEIALAEEFGVSRTPIRRVLQRLEFERLAERTQGSYTTVTSFDLESLMDVYNLRMVLSENMDQFSSRPLSADGIRELEKLLEQAEHLLKAPNIEALGRIHLAFQEELAGCLGNSRVREITMQLYNQIARIWLYRLPQMDWNEEIRIFCSEIRNTIEAMRAGDIRTVGLIRRNSIAMNLHRMRRK